MFRNIMNDLATWYETGKDKIALIKGGKSVGKTWAAVDFATGFFDSYILIDLKEHMDFVEYISKERKPEKIHAKLTTSIDKYDFTGKLLIFDNAQVCPMAVKNISLYNKFRTEFRTIVIWSGNYEPMDEEGFQEDVACFELMPMNFEEFLKAGKGRKLCRYIENQKMEEMGEEIKKSVWAMLNAFFLTGGMPEAVNEYYRSEDFEEVDKVLEKILQDMVKYLIEVSPKKNLSKMLAIWNSIPVQLTKDNKKFMYGYVDEKARAREYVSSVNLLVNTGVVRQIFRIKDGTLPLDQQIDDKSFELYHIDHGLLRVMAGIKVGDVSDENILDLMDGAIAEQYSLSELYLNKNINDLYFWISSATAKVDFVYEGDNEVIPVDVQTSPRTKAQSVKVFKQRYDNETSVRISTDDMFVKKGLINIPLYGIWCF